MFWWKPLHVPIRKRKQKSWRISNFALLLLFLSHVMSGKGLSERLKRKGRSKEIYVRLRRFHFYSDWPCGRFPLTERCLHPLSLDCSARWKQNQHRTLLQCCKTIAGGRALRHLTQDSRFKPQDLFRHQPTTTPLNPPMWRSQCLFLGCVNLLTKKLEAQVIQSNLVFYAQSTSTSDTE